MVVGTLVRAAWSPTMTVEAGKLSARLLGLGGFEPGPEGIRLLDVHECLGELVRSDAGPPDLPFRGPAETDLPTILRQGRFWRTRAEAAGAAPPSEPGRRFVGRTILVRRPEEDVVFLLGRIALPPARWGLELGCLLARELRVWDGAFVDGPAVSEQLEFGAKTVEDILDDPSFWRLDQSPLPSP